MKLKTKIYSLKLLTNVSNVRAIKLSSKLVRRRYKLVKDIADASIVHCDELSELLVDPDSVDAGPLDVECLERLLLSARPSLGEFPLSHRRGGEAESVQVS